jgi:Domain of unknown function (DUF4136)
MKQRCTTKILLLACSLLGLLAMTGCASGPTIRSSMDESVDFNRFRTFDFLVPLGTDREGFQTLISQQLVGSAERELLARGLTRTATNPDLLINFSANLDQRLRITQSPGTSAGSMNRHRRGFYTTWPSYQQTDIRQYTQGTLGIDVIDAARRQLIWEGVAVGRVTQSTTDNIGPVLNNAVVDIFHNFPLPPR